MRARVYSGAWCVCACACIVVSGAYVFVYLCMSSRVCVCVCVCESPEGEAMCSDFRTAMAGAMHPLYGDCVGRGAVVV